MSALGQKQTFAVQKGMSALPLKAVEIADIARWRAEHFCSALYFKRRPAPRSRGRRPHQCRDTAQCSLSWCDQAKAGRRVDSRCGGRLASPSFYAVSVCRTNEGLRLDWRDPRLTITQGHAPRSNSTPVSCATRTVMEFFPSPSLAPRYLHIALG
jgi:hypothetical protein